MKTTYRPWLALTQKPKWLSIAAFPAGRRPPHWILKTMQKTSQRGRLVVAGLVIVAVLVATLTLPLDQWLDQAGEWNKAHPVAGALFYLLFVTVGAVFFLPGSVIAMSAGYVYGLTLGSCLAVVGVALGGFAAFLAGRLLVREWVFSQLESHPRLQALDRAVYDKSFVIVALTRLSLIIPFNILNYAYGVTGVKKIPYIAGTALGMIPATVLWTYVGTLAKNFGDIRSGELDTGLPSEYLLLLGLAIIGVAVAIVHRAASRALKERLEQ